MNFYLKYRPQKISQLDLIEVRQRLGEALASQNVPHAFLFAGPKGTGKTSSARIVAKSVNCLKNKTQAEPCNRCDSCAAINKGRAIDVLEIDAASNRGIDDIRDLREKIKLAPSSLKFKVYIIDEVHMLTKEAFNALLKTLEEPPAHAVFILCTTEIEKLPETIISRCLLVKFNKATPDELKRSLGRVVKAENLTIAEPDLQLVALSSDGSFRDAVKILQQLADVGKKISSKRVGELLAGGLKTSQLEDWLGLIFKRQATAALKWLGEAWQEGTRPKYLLLATVERLRQALLASVGAGGAELPAAPGAGEVKDLLQLLLNAEAQMKGSPIEALPLELAIVIWCGQTTVGPAAPPPAQNALVADQELLTQWPSVLEAVKPLNHSLEALLKATEPVGFEGGFLVIKVFYQFHKDRLEEERYRQMVEQVASKVLAAPVKIKFLFASRPAQADIIKTAEEVFGVNVGGD